MLVLPLTGLGATRAAAWRSDELCSVFCLATEMPYSKLDAPPEFTGGSTLSLYVSSSEENAGLWTRISG